MGVSGQVSQHGLWPTEGRLGVDAPIHFAQWGEPFGEGVGVRRIDEIAEELQLSYTVQSHEAFDKQSPE